MRTVTMTDAEWRRSLALVRTQHIIEDIGGFNPWSELLDLLELDKPQEVPVPQSIRADHEASLALASQAVSLAGKKALYEKAERVHRLQLVGQDQAIREAKAQR